MFALVILPTEFVLHVNHQNPLGGFFNTETTLRASCNISCGAPFYAEPTSGFSAAPCMPSFLPFDDVRLKLGGEIQPFGYGMPTAAGFLAYSTMGRCSWVRFLTLTTKKNDANLILLRRHPVTFQATQGIGQGEPICLFVDSDLYHSAYQRPLAETLSPSPAALPSVFGFPPKTSLDLELHIRQQLHKGLIDSTSPKQFTTPEPNGPDSTSASKEKKYLNCSFCGKKFDRPSLLQRHERIHTGKLIHDHRTAHAVTLT
ncbi:hypothetical protein RvY_09569 [Ramazzottius varieornatus]|uniref:C2H2-type domain-containing protein n=1 Tax=Ramazzottius varieornatus TaxID=947166 RepID=A0A1D1VF93_RAMVA|nr:hypothetical protein RvY_09569 [Ramazzottius varieornatus]